MKFILRYLSIILLTIILSCKSDKVSKNYITENIIIIVIDGPRYSETWGHINNQYIPYQSILAQDGIVMTNFKNNGVTTTVPGHTAITTGYYQNINNGGAENPLYPSIFQYWLKISKANNTKAWIIASKDKLEALSNCSSGDLKDLYRPSTDCGVNGLFTGYREDTVTYLNTINILETYSPNLVLINFKEPDVSAHQNDWPAYINGIETTDEYVHLIWQYLENNPNYKGKTTLFVTNDHGRHLDGVGTGFIGHGDYCDGCKSISLFTLGPDFKKGAELDIERNQLDISATIAEMMYFDFPNGEGHVMEELFK